VIAIRQQEARRTRFYLTRAFRYPHHARETHRTNISWMNSRPARFSSLRSPPLNVSRVVNNLQKLSLQDYPRFMFERITHVFRRHTPPPVRDDSKFGSPVIQDVFWHSNMSWSPSQIVYFKERQFLDRYGKFESRRFTLYFNLSNSETCQTKIKSRSNETYVLKLYQIVFIWPVWKLNPR